MDRSAGMSDQTFDMQALAQAFEEFNRTTQSMEEAYRALEARVKELDEELAEKNRELEVTTEYLNSTLESMSDGVITIDTDGRITTFNLAAAQILGYTAEEVQGQSFADMFGREFDVPPGSHAGELRTIDGAVCPITERNAPLADRTGAVIGSVKVFQDMSELEALRERVRQKDRLAAIGEMAATVAHEIRNPLGGIRGFAALLERDMDKEDPKARLVEKVLAGARALDKVVGELLEYTRPLELHLRSTNCADLIEATLGYLELGDKDIVLKRDVPPDLTLRIDPDKMRQVFLNVLINAVQAIDEAGEVTIGATQNNGVCSITIGDSGMGIPRDQLDHVFVPFYTTKEKGTGLGLAAAAKIVEAHGGSIEASSTHGEGATFTVRLPGAR